MLDSFCNTCIAYKILTNNIFYIYICRKKLSKIKIDKILFKIDYVQKILNGLVILPIEKKILVELENKNIISSNLKSQKSK